MELYRDTAVLGVARGPRHGQDSATTRLSLLHDTAEPAPRHDHQKATIRQAYAGGVRQRARAWFDQGACHDTNFVLWVGAAFVSQYGCDTSCDTATVRHDTTLGAATPAAARDTARSHGLGARCVAIQPATRPGRPATRSPMPATLPRGGHDTSGPGL